MANKKQKKSKVKAAAKKSARKVGKLASAKKANGNGAHLPKPSNKPYGQAGKALAGRAHSRLHARAIGSDLHAAFGLVRRRRDQGRASRRRRHHARPIGRREGRRLALLHHAQPQQALDHHRLQASAGHARAGSAGENLRRAGGELRARRARPHGADLGAHPQAQSAHDRRVGQGLRPRALRGLQGL